MSFEYNYNNVTKNESIEVESRGGGWKQLNKWLGTNATSMYYVIHNQNKNNNNKNNN